MKTFLNLIDRHWLAIVIFGTVLFLLLTMFIGANQSVWFDEDYSVVLAKSSWCDLLSLTAVDVHPPFYYVLLKIWGSLFAFNDTMLRLFSAIMASGAVFGALAIARKCFGRRAAVLAVPFMILTPFLMRYGFELRMYSLAALLAVASTYVLIVLIKNQPRKLWILYGILVALGMLTLNYMIFVYSAHLIWLVARYFKTKPHTKLIKEKWVWSYVLAIAIYLFWLPFAIGQLINDVSPGIATAIGPVEIVKILSFTFVYQPEYWLNKWLGVLLMAAIVVAIYFIYRAFKLISSQQRWLLWLLLAIAIGPIVLMMLSSLISDRGFFVERYIAHFIWSLYLVTGVTIGIVLLKGKKLILNLILSSVILLAFLAGLLNLNYYGNFNFQRLQSNAARQIVDDIGGCRPDRVIVVDDKYEYFEIQHYLSNCHNLYFYSPNDIEFSGGYAWLKNHSARLTNQIIDTSQLIVVRIKDQVNYQVPSGYSLVSTNNHYDVVSIETYQLL
jgi:uncharacterized membrane protein